VWLSLSHTSGTDDAVGQSVNPIYPSEGAAETIKLTDDDILII
jgi:hypothetical protein